MTKEQELMNYLHEKVFDPILDSPKASPKIKKGVRYTIMRMNRLSAEKMVQYFWSALVQPNAIEFSKEMEAEKMPRFEDIQDEFKMRFDDKWLKS